MSVQVHPHTLMFSLYAQCVLPRGGEIWIGSLIRALAALDFTEGAVRALVSRMKRNGYLQSRRIGRRSFYRLTDRGADQVRHGGRRAFEPLGDEWDGTWTVVIYTIPEQQRERRDALRTKLQYDWGFGSLAPGAWISPRPFSPQAQAECQDLGVWQSLKVFRADHVGPAGPRALAAQAWPQLSALAALYRDYYAEYEGVPDRARAGQLGDAESFAAYLRSLCEFVAIALQDPALPSSLLPEDWPRSRVRLLTKQLHQALREPAERFFDSVFETADREDANALKRIES
jgi:phenylacetic acid degradation operon negative regulatory protein